MIVQHIIIVITTSGHDCTPHEYSIMIDGIDEIGVI